MDSSSWTRFNSASLASLAFLASRAFSFFINSAMRSFSFWRTWASFSARTRLFSNSSWAFCSARTRSISFWFSILIFSTRATWACFRESNWGVNSAFRVVIWLIEIGFWALTASNLALIWLIESAASKPGLSDKNSTKPASSLDCKSIYSSFLRLISSWILVLSSTSF